jgi:uncharacterized protein YgiM (DUF1202 family)
MRLVTPRQTLVWVVAAAGLVGVSPVSTAPRSWAQTPSASQPAPGRVRVPTSYANVHMGPSSGQEVLVLVPRGTILTVLGRDNEWIQVRLTPELRKTGMVLRWYKNEESGWMHDSTVEVLKPGER